MPSKPGQGRSTFGEGDPRPFQQWLREQLDHYEWSYGRLARELQMSKGAVSRWFADPDEDTFRRPAYASLKLMADLFGTDLAYLLDLAGVDEEDSHAESTTMQREAIGIVSAMPDVLLASVLPQLKALATREDRDEVIGSIRQMLCSA